LKEIEENAREKRKKDIEKKKSGRSRSSRVSYI